MCDLLLANLRPHANDHLGHRSDDCHDNGEPLRTGHAALLGDLLQGLLDHSRGKASQSIRDVLALTLLHDLLQRLGILRVLRLTLTQSHSLPDLLLLLRVRWLTASQPLDLHTIGEQWATWASAPIHATVYTLR